MGCKVKGDACRVEGLGVRQNLEEVVDLLDAPRAVHLVGGS